jgi:hypothetical protein
MFLNLFNLILDAVNNPLLFGCRCLLLLTLLWLLPLIIRTFTFKFNLSESAILLFLLITVYRPIVIDRIPLFPFGPLLRYGRLHIFNDLFVLYVLCC